MASLILATRSSPLALAQSRWVADRVEASNPGLKIDLLPLKTSGDKFIDRPLMEAGGKGLFVKELEEALLDGRADFAVHSLKDVPRALPAGLELAVYPERATPWDVLITAAGEPTVAALPKGARVGTSSLRRQIQLAKLRPDLQFVPVRGNVGTRLGKLGADLQAIVLAQAGLVRLGETPAHTSVLKIPEMIPAPGQGILGLEIRADDAKTRATIAPLAHVDTTRQARCERAFLRRLEADCQIPVGGYAELRGDQLRMVGFVGSGDLKTYLLAHGDGSEPEAVGVAVADALLAQGAAAIIRSFRR